MRSSASIIRLLVIDDDPLQCELLTHVLSSSGFVVAALNSGEAATALFAGAHSPFDALLIDLQLPGTAGDEVAPALRAQAENAVIIGMSARTPLAHERQAFDMFLAKPFGPAALREAFEQAQENHASVAPTRLPPSQPTQMPRRTTSSGRGSETGTRLRETAPGELSDSASSGDASSSLILNQRIFAQLQATIGVDPLRQLYEMTAADVEARLTRMSLSLKAGDEQEVRREAHAIKGSCAMVGATELSQLAAGIEAGSETDSLQLSAMREACIRLRRMVTIVQP